MTINDKILIISSSELHSRVDEELNLFKWRFGDWDSYTYMWSSLETIFDEVLFFSYNENLLKNGYIETNDEIVRIVRKDQPKYVLLYGMQHFNILESTFKAINNTDSKIVAYFVDDITEFDNFTKYLIPYIDYIVTADSVESNQNYEKYGGKAIFMPSGVSEKHFYQKEGEYKYDVSFVGVNKYGRDKSIEYLESQNIKVSVFGEGWATGRISTDELNDVYNKSKISLNFTKSSAGIAHMKWRTFEIPASNGFMLTEHIEGIENYFEIGKEIVCFRTLEEAVEKINYYLVNDDERERIKTAGYRRANKNYTWKECFRKIFFMIEHDPNVKNSRPEVAQDEKFRNIRLGMRVIYAIIFYLEIGKTKHYKEMVKLVEDEGYYNAKSGMIFFIFKHFPYCLGKKIVRLIYTLYFEYRKATTNDRIKNKDKV